MISPLKVSSHTAPQPAVDGCQSSPSPSPRTPSIESRTLPAEGKPQSAAKESAQSAMSPSNGLGDILQKAESTLRGAMKLVQDLLKPLLDLAKSAFDMLKSAIDMLKTAMSSVLSLIK